MSERRLLIVCGTIVALALIGLYGFTKAMDGDPDQIVRWIGGVGGQVMGIVTALVMLSRTRREVSELREQTNGHLTRLVESVTAAPTAGVAAGQDDDGPSPP